MTKKAANKKTLKVNEKLKEGLEKIYRISDKHSPEYVISMQVLWQCGFEVDHLQRLEDKEDA